jgi:hypothetical protein
MMNDGGGGGGGGGGGDDDVALCVDYSLCVEVLMEMRLFYACLQSTTT